MPATDSLVVFAEHLETLLKTNMDAWGIEDVWYGDQKQIARTPTVCVVPDAKDREIRGAPRRTQVQLRSYLMIYHGKVQDVQLNSKEADRLGETIEAGIHADPTLGGLVIHSLVTRLETGETTRMVNTQKTLYRTTRLTVVGDSVTNLPMSPGYNQ